jgi:hypothetical protein
MLRRTTYILTILFAASFLSQPATAQDSEEGKANQDEITKLERSTLTKLRRAARRLEGEVRRLPKVDSAEHTTPAELARRLNARRKPEAVFDWMRENIAYEPYEGAVRGARGTLISRRANDVDQALLAKAIFDEANVETRFAVGRAPDEAWKKLGERVLGDVSIELGDEDVAIADTMRGWDNLRPSRHLWLVVREGDSFKAFDPVLSERYATGYGDSQSTADELPERFQSSFNMKVHSRLQDGQEHVVSELAGTLSDFMGESVTLAFEPAIAREGHVEPVLRIGDKQNTGKRIPANALERLELEFKMRAGGRSYRFKKLLYLKGTTPELFAHTQQTYGIAVLPGWVRPHWARKEIGTHLDALAETIDDWTHERIRASRAQSSLQYRASLETFMMHLAASLPPLYALTIDRTPLEVAAALGVLPVMSTPRVVVTGVMRTGSDITVDYWRGGGEIDAVGADGLPRAIGSGLAAISGFDEGHLAQELFRDMTQKQVLGTEDIFAIARKQNIPFGTLHARNTRRIGRLAVSDFLKDELRDHAVEGGELILTPQKAVEVAGQAHLGWWSITPSNDQFRAYAPTTFAPVNSAANRARDIDIAGILRAAMAVRSALADRLPETAPNTQICRSAAGAENLSKAFCAEKKLQSLPTLETCLKESAGSNALLGAAGSVTAGPGSQERIAPREHCNNEARRTRCGLVVANAVLSGDLPLVDHGEDDANDEKKADSDEGSSESAPFCN